MKNPRTRKEWQEMVDEAHRQLRHHQFTLSYANWVKFMNILVRGRIRGIEPNALEPEE